MSNLPFPNWGEFDFKTITDEQYFLQIEEIRNKYEVYNDDPRMREVPPVKAEGTETYDDYFTIMFKSYGGEIMGLYQKRDQYLFASKVIRESGTEPFEMVRGTRFRLANINIKVVDLDVTYDSLHGGVIPSYTLNDMSNAVSTLARGSHGNEHWGHALATLIGATSDAVKSIGMERHVYFGLNIKTNVPHIPSNRLLRINNAWSKISKSIRSGMFDYKLMYNNENGVPTKEAVTRHSAGMILALINTKDGTKQEKFTNKQTKGYKRKRDDSQDKGVGESSRTTGAGKMAGKKNVRQKGNPQTSGGKYRRYAAGDIVAEEKHPSSLCETLECPEETRIGFLKQTVDESVKEEEQEPEIQTEKIHKPMVEEPKAIITVGDSSSYDSSDSSDSHETIAEEESKINKENSPAPEEGKTPTDSKEGRLDLDFDSDSEIQAIQLAKSSTTDLMSGPNVPTSSILIKHGTKRPTEVGDEDSKQAKKMASTKSTDDENEQNWSNLS